MFNSVSDSLFQLFWLISLFHNRLRLKKTTHPTNKKWKGGEWVSAHGEESIEVKKWYQKQLLRSFDLGPFLGGSYKGEEYFIKRRKKAGK